MSKSLPTKQECDRLWDKYEMPDHIRAHTRQVTNVAKKVAKHIKNQGYPVDIVLVERGALLHDIAKIISIKDKSKGYHTDIGAQIVRKEGYASELADIVLHHVVNSFDSNLTLEQQIVNYADRRVTHDKVVSVQERIDYLKTQNPDRALLIDEKLPLYLQFERKYHLDHLEYTSPNVPNSFR